MTLASSECLAQNWECALFFFFLFLFFSFFCALLHLFQCSNALCSFLFLSLFFLVVCLQQHSRGSEETKEEEEGRQRGKVKSKWRIRRCSLALMSRDGIDYLQFVSNFCFIFTVFGFKRDKYQDETFQKEFWHADSVLCFSVLLDCQHCELLQRSLKHHCYVHPKSTFTHSPPLRINWRIIVLDLNHLLREK